MMASEEMISKKKILERTGISYGQFYRWKRKGLIPDGWIVHKSTKTGQESFLPKARVLKRIEKVKSLKEDNTLDEIADLLSPEIVEKKYGRSTLLELEWLGAELVSLYENIVGSRKHFSFVDILSMDLLSRLKGSGFGSKALFLAIKTISSQQDEKYFDEELIVAKQRLEPGNSPNSFSKFCLLAGGEVKFDETVEVLERIDLSRVVENVKLKLRDPSQFQRDANEV